MADGGDAAVCLVVGNAGCLGLPPALQRHLLTTVCGGNEDRLRRLLAALCVPARPTTLRITRRIPVATEDLLASLRLFVARQCAARGWARPLCVALHPHLSDVVVVEDISDDGRPVVATNVTPAALMAIVDVRGGQAVMRGADVFSRGLITMSQVC